MNIVWLQSAYPWAIWSHFCCSIAHCSDNPHTYNVSCIVHPLGNTHSISSHKMTYDRNILCSHECIRAWKTCGLVSCGCWEVKPSCPCCFGNRGIYSFGCTIHLRRNINSRVWYTLSFCNGRFSPLRRARSYVTAEWFKFERWKRRAFWTLVLLFDIHFITETDSAKQHPRQLTFLSDAWSIVRVITFVKNQI